MKHLLLGSSFPSASTWVPLKFLTATNTSRLRATTVYGVVLLKILLIALLKDEKMPTVFLSLRGHNSFLLMTNMIRSTMTGSSCEIKNKTFSGELRFLYKLFLIFFSMFLKTSAWM